MCFFFFFNETATTEIYTYLHTLSLHDALPISSAARGAWEANWEAGRGVGSGGTAAASLTGGADGDASGVAAGGGIGPARSSRSEEHTSELQSLMRNSYAVFCLKKKK